MRSTALCSIFLLCNTQSKICSIRKRFGYLEFSELDPVWVCGSRLLSAEGCSLFVVLTRSPWGGDLIYGRASPLAPWQPNRRNVGKDWWWPESHFIAKIFSKRLPWPWQASAWSSRISVLFHIFFSSNITLFLSSLDCLKIPVFITCILLNSLLYPLWPAFLNSTWEVTMENPFDSQQTCFFFFK